MVLDIAKAISWTIETTDLTAEWRISLPTFNMRPRCAHPDSSDSGSVIGLPEQAVNSKNR